MRLSVWTKVVRLTPDCCSAIGALAILILGCGPKAPSPEEVQPRPGYYEIAWVDPAIIQTDDLLTLIRSERIDSFYVETPEAAQHFAPTLRFRIQSGCLQLYQSGVTTLPDVIGPHRWPSSQEPTTNVVINVYDAYGELYLPLLVQKLPIGHYKLALNESGEFYKSLPAGSYYFKADLCGETLTSSFVVE